MILTGKPYTAKKMPQSFHFFDEIIIVEIVFDSDYASNDRSDKIIEQTSIRRSHIEYSGAKTPITLKQRIVSIKTSLYTQLIQYSMQLKWLSSTKKYSRCFSLTPFVAHTVHDLGE